MTQYAILKSICELIAKTINISKAFAYITNKLQNKNDIHFARRKSSFENPQQLSKFIFQIYRARFTQEYIWMIDVVLQ